MKYKKCSQQIVKYILIYFILTVSFGINCLAYEIVSLDSNYVVEFIGSNDEGFFGIINIALKCSDNLIWSKQITKAEYNSIDMPAVSNLGDIALPLNNTIIFLDINQNLKGIFNPENDEKLWYISDSFRSTKHAYTNCGNTYFTFTTKGINRINYNTFLNTLTDSGKINWKVDLGKFRPSYIQIYDSLIIIDDFSGATLNEYNNIFTYTINGDRVMNYKSKSISIGCGLVLQKDKNEIWIYDKDKPIAIDLYSGKVKYQLTPEAIVPLIYNCNPRTQKYVLFYLACKADISSINFTEKDKQRLIELSKIKRNPKKWYNYGLGKISKTILDKMNSL